MKDADTYLVFAVQGQHFALPWAWVECVTPATAVQAVRGMPGVVLGSTYIEGQWVPVLSFARWLGCPPRPLAPAAWFVLVRTEGRSMVLVVDRIVGVQPRSADLRSDDPPLLTNLAPLLALGAGIASADRPNPAPRPATADAGHPRNREYACSP